MESADQVSEESGPICLSTSSRTPTRPSSNCWHRWPVRRRTIATFFPWATKINQSTASEARITATCYAFAMSIPRPRSSAGAELPQHPDHPRRGQLGHRQQQGRTPKTLFTENGKGLDVTVYEGYNEIEEASYVLDEIERLVGSRAFSLRRHRNHVSHQRPEPCAGRGDGVAQHEVSLVGGTRFYERKEIKDALAFLRLVNNPRTAWPWTASSTCRPAASAPRPTAHSRVGRPRWVSATTERCAFCTTDPRPSASRWATLPDAAYDAPFAKARQERAGRFRGHV
jgi:hypothetical protein